VLLVEDDADVRGNVKEMVEGLGYTVVESANADDALSVLRARDDIALLFTDVIMRGSADGLELAKSANTLQPGLPVLFTSGYTGAALEAAGGRAEKVQLLSKPYRVDELARALRRAIDRTG
jgi:CheY-like chemotaxis protein